MRPRKQPDRSWREQHRQNAHDAAKIASAHLARSGRILRPRTSRKRSIKELAAQLTALADSHASQG